DLAVASEESDDVAVLFGNGDGTFASPVRLKEGISRGLATSSGWPLPRLLATGDFDGDGYADLAVLANFNGVMVYHGGDHRTFTSATAVPNTYLFGDIVAADVDGDGRDDLVFASGTALIT